MNRVYLKADENGIEWQLPRPSICCLKNPAVKMTSPVESPVESPVDSPASSPLTEVKFNRNSQGIKNESKISIRVFTFCKSVRERDRERQRNFLTIFKIVLHFLHDTEFH
jgi:hypothetical protein